MSVSTFIKNELGGWEKWEIAWLCTACGTILGLSLYWEDALVGIISALTGVISVICTGKGKLSAYIFGVVNVVLYSWLSFQERYYGEVMLNMLYYFPMEFYGFYVWHKFMNTETLEVVKRAMKRKSLLLVLLLVVTATLLYGTFLNYIGGNLSYVDALSTVVSVVALFLSVKRYAEQWILWIVVDVVTVFMWAVAFSKGNENMATLLMWVVYLFNAIIMYYKWQKEAKANAE